MMVVHHSRYFGILYALTHAWRPFCQLNKAHDYPYSTFTTCVCVPFVHVSRLYVISTFQMLYLHTSSLTIINYNATFVNYSCWGSGSIGWRSTISENYPSKILRWCNNILLDTYCWCLLYIYTTIRGTYRRQSR